MKLFRLVVALTLAAGTCLTGRALYVHAKAELAGILIRRAWDATSRSGKACPPWPWADTHPVARLRIPRIHYDEIVLEGTTPRTLAFGPARLFSGAGLGEPGNLELAGHRTNWFEPLKAVATDDIIQIEWYDARRGSLRERTYIVNAIRVVAPDDVSLLAATADDALTLVTCYPFGHSPHSPQRYMVRALPAGPSQPSQLTAVDHSSVKRNLLPVLQTVFAGIARN